jgi:hypothetical protein
VSGNVFVAVSVYSIRVNFDDFLRSIDATLLRRECNLLNIAVVTFCCRPSSFHSPEQSQILFLVFFLDPEAFGSFFCLLCRLSM